MQAGVPISLREHIKEILKNYDIVQVPNTFLGNLRLPEQGRFFVVNPENPETFWNSKFQELSHIQ